MEEKQCQRGNVIGPVPMTNIKSEVITSNANDDGGPLIRIKSQNDVGLFEQEENTDNEDGNDDDYLSDFPMPEVQLEEGKVRNRKQELNFHTSSNFLDELVGITEEDYLSSSSCFKRGAEEDLSPSSKKRSGNVFLYNLNPDNYAHDPRRQTQIKRAIVTYRHHQLKKKTIISQRKEISQLRSHNKALKAKVLELRGCGCEKNEKVNIDIVDEVIPAANFSDKLFSHAKWPTLKSMEKSFSCVETETPKESTTLVMTPTPEKPVEVEALCIKPLVNIRSSRLGNITLKGMETEVLTPSPVHSPSVVTSFVKQTSSPVNRTAFGGPVVKRCIPFSSAEVDPKKYDARSPATAVPASKLVFMNKFNDAIQPHTQELGQGTSLRFLNSAKTNSTVANADSVGRWIAVPSYQPIAPRPDVDAVDELDSLDEEIKKRREMEKMTLEQQFKKLDGDEEDEVAILGSFYPKQQRQRKRKQAVQRLTYRERKDKGQDLLVNQKKGEFGINKIKVELEERYSDIIFEEASPDSKFMF